MAAAEKIAELKLMYEEIARRHISSISPEGCWEGCLSSSALATALAAYALFLYDRTKYSNLINGAADWLAGNQNADGGWGDTPRSKSNLSTTLLCISTLVVLRADGENGSLDNAKKWLEDNLPDTSAETIINAVNEKYGNDLTFSCPILSVCALSGLLGDKKRAFGKIRPLPFEIACLPKSFFRFINMPVVSYALPALIALGQLHYHQKTPSNPLIKMIRSMSLSRTLSKLEAIQPAAGGFLEAAPLTSFAAISLCSINQRRHPVTKKCIDFLTQTVRNNLSWPIDTNLSTWLTSLSVNALAGGGNFSDILPPDRQQMIYRYLIEGQFKNTHPFTGAEPGGWAWTSLDGGVPDADDTSAALTALVNLRKQEHLREQTPHDEFQDAVTAGINWLINLQNKDGGVPTFCKGRTNLDFDTSAPDITAHASSALSQCEKYCPKIYKKKIDVFISAAIRYLTDSQNENGLWVPLWFGNEYMPDEKNPVFGTARIITYICGSGDISRFPKDMIERAVKALLAGRNEDGGWGRITPDSSSIEETAAVLDALVSFALSSKTDNAELETAIDKGTERLIDMLSSQQSGNLEPAPIGLYFAKLWYYEKMYPTIFTLSAAAKIIKY